MPRKKSAAIAAAGRVIVPLLEEFYSESGFPPPLLTRIEGNELPEPYQSLLVHQQDLTLMLKKYYQQLIHLRILGERLKGDVYSREYVLLLDENERLVEFGGIKIHLSFLSNEVRRRVMKGRRPLGHILEENKIRHRSRPGFYFHLTSGPAINRALNLVGPNLLYGRCSTLIDAKLRPLAELFEVLEPVNR